ncbi:MAG: malonyl-CoA decarboxylase [Rubrivivax sp.]
MLDELRQAALRQRTARSLRRLTQDSQHLLSDDAELGGMTVTGELIDRLDGLDDAQLDGYFDFLANDLSPDPTTVLRCAEAYAAAPGARTLMALTAAAEPPRQELLRRLNRGPGGTAAVLALRRALLPKLKARPELAALESDLQHLLGSWFNPGFLQMKRVDWQSPAQLLERIIHHEAVHTIDGWDDLRRRLQPDRRCFAFFHPQLGDEPLIFVEVALLAEVPDAIAPLIDKNSTPTREDRFRVAAFYSISNCEPGLRGVSLGNFLIKTVAQQLQRELPQLKTFCTLSPIPGFARWFLSDPDLATLPPMRKGAMSELVQARKLLLERCDGDLSALQSPAVHERLQAPGADALRLWCSAYLLALSPTPAGDPVARFHLDNGARLERINLRGNLSPHGLKQSFGVMVNYRYDLTQLEASHARFRKGEVTRSRAVGNAV